MKYRSFNEQLLIATALLINVFNDIVIDRRKHGFRRDFSKALSLKQIAQQKIEIPCILGQRSSILRSLQNEAGKYKLPLMILTNKTIKTDVSRMVDLHSDVFYQQDNQFSQLDPEDPHYKPQQIGKRRAQPVVMDFDLTIITKYKQDLDQIISNWAVFFRPDIYVKWWSPRREGQTVNSQILWNQNIGFDLPIEYNPTNVFSYKASTSFSFKTWLFPGMYSVQNKINPDSQAIIKKFKFYPNRGSWYDQEDLATGIKDSNDTDSQWNFEQESSESSNTQDLGQMGFWGVGLDQEFYNSGDDEEGLKAGKYAVNNVFAKNYAAISGDPILSKTRYNTLIGDIFSNYDKYLINQWNKYQNYLGLQKVQEYDGQAFLKNVYFKGGFPQSALLEYPPSGDFLYRHFAKTYIKNKSQDDQKIVSAQFGDSFIDQMNMTFDYNIDTKNFMSQAVFNDNNINVKMLNISNSNSGIYQKFSMNSITTNSQKQIKFNFERSCDNNFNIIQQKSITQTQNVVLFNNMNSSRNIQFYFQNDQFKDTATKILNILGAYKNSIQLNQLKSGKYQIQFNDSKIGSILKSKGLLDLPFRTFSLIGQSYVNNVNYQIYLNKYVYLVLKLNNQNDADIYDYGIYAPLKFNLWHAPIFEIAIPQSRMLLGFAMNMQI